MPRPFFLKEAFWHVISLLQAGKQASRQAAIIMGDEKGRQARRGVEEEHWDFSEAGADFRHPLKAAARDGHEEVARSLLKAGVPPNTRDEEGTTALHASAEAGQTQVVQLLLEAGAMLNTVDDEGLTPLHWAASADKSAVVEQLLRHGANPNVLGRQNFTPLYFAIDRGSDQAALALLAGGADVDIPCGYDNLPVIIKAVDRDSIAVVKALILRGVDAARTLVQNSFMPVPPRRLTALHAAAKTNSAGVIRPLLNAGANIDSRQYFEQATPLHIAAKCGGAEALSAFVKNGADINATDSYNRSPLWIVAARAGCSTSIAMLETLLRAGADETIVDDDGQAPVDVVGKWYMEDKSVDRDEQRALAASTLRAASVKRLLLRAPADRAWRRRALWVMCRAHPDKVRLALEVSRAKRARADGIGTAAADAGERGGGGGGGGEESGGATHGTSADDIGRVAARVLGLQEEGIFRHVVGFL